MVKSLSTTVSSVVTFVGFAICATLATASGICIPLIGWSGRLVACDGHSQMGDDLFDSSCDGHYPDKLFTQNLVTILSLLGCLAIALLAPVLNTLTCACPARPSRLVLFYGSAVALGLFFLLMTLMSLSGVFVKCPAFFALSGMEREALSSPTPSPFPSFPLPDVGYDALTVRQMLVNELRQECFEGMTSGVSFWFTMATVDLLLVVLFAFANWSRSLYLKQEGGDLDGIPV